MNGVGGNHRHARRLANDRIEELDQEMVARQMRTNDALKVYH